MICSKAHSKYLYRFLFILILSQNLTSLNSEATSVGPLYMCTNNICFAVGNHDSGTTGSAVSGSISDLFNHGPPQNYDNIRNSAAQAQSETETIKEQIKKLKAETDRYKANSTHNQSQASIDIDEILKEMQLAAPSPIIDYSKIAPPTDSEIPFQFESPEGLFKEEVKDIYRNLYKIEPYYKNRKIAKSIGLSIIQEADRSYAIRDPELARFYQQLGQEFLDIAVGQDFEAKLAKSAYQHLTGQKFETGIVVDAETKETFDLENSIDSPLQTVLKGKSSVPFRDLSLASKLRLKSILYRLAEADSQQNQNHTHSKVRNYRRMNDLVEDMFKDGSVTNEQGVVNHLAGANYDDLILSTSSNTPEGADIRSRLNWTMLAQSMVSQKCQSANSTALIGMCQDYLSRSEDLVVSHRLADWYAANGNLAAFQDIENELNPSIEFIKGFVTGIGDGALTFATALPELLGHLPETGKALFQAIVHHEATWKAIKEAAHAKFEFLKQANAEEWGKFVGELTFDVGSTFLVGGIEAKILKKASRWRAGVEQVAAVAVADTTAETVAGANIARSYLEALVEAGAGSESIHLTALKTANVINSAEKKWTSVKGLLHTVKGNAVLAADGTFKLKSGMHTEKGLAHFIKLNTEKGNHYVIQTVEAFTEENLASKVILKQTLPNGVVRLQLPREAWHSKSAFSGAAIRNFEGIKTLWPKHFSISDIAEATESIMLQNGSPTARKISGVYKGIKVRINRNIEGKVITSFPSWQQ
jgi:hypothetical protein